MSSGIRISDSIYNISSLLGTNILTVNVDGTVAANEVIVNQFIISDGSHSTTLSPQSVVSSNNLTLTVTNDLAINTAIFSLTSTGNFGLNSTVQPITFTAPSLSFNPVTPGAGLELLYPHTDNFTIASQNNMILESISTSLTLQAQTSVITIAPTLYISPAAGDGALSYNGSGNFSINSSGTLTFNATSFSFPSGAFTLASLNLSPSVGDATINNTGSGNLVLNSTNSIKLQKDTAILTGNLDLSASGNATVAYSGTGTMKFTSSNPFTFNNSVQIDSNTLTLHPGSSDSSIVNTGPGKLLLTSSGGNIEATTPIFKITSATSVTAVTPTLFLSPAAGDGTINYNGAGNLIITSSGTSTMTSTSHLINAPVTLQKKLLISSLTGTTVATYTVTNSIVQSISVGSPTTITKFDGGILNQIIIIFTPSDANTTIQHNSNIFLTGTVDIALTQRSAIGFICTDATAAANVWMELFRSIK
jgi:hypothetical protein